MLYNQFMNELNRIPQEIDRNKILQKNEKVFGVLYCKEMELSGFEPFDYQPSYPIALLTRNVTFRGVSNEKIKGQMTESIGFTRANLPGNAMIAVVDANIKTATEALDNAKATMAKYEGAEDDQSRYLYQQAEKSYIDAQNIIQQNNAIYDSMFRQLDGNNPDHSEVIEDTKAELLSYYRGDNKDELAAAIKSLKRPEDIINTFLRYGEGAELKDFRASLSYTGFIDKGKVDKSNLTRYFLTAANNVGIKPQTQNHSCLWISDPPFEQLGQKQKPLIVLLSAAT